MQLLLASVYSGAFHPSAEGQAAIADAVVDQARAVLAKYEKRTNRVPSRVNLGLVDELLGQEGAGHRIDVWWGPGCLLMESVGWLRWR